MVQDVVLRNATAGFPDGGYRDDDEDGPRQHEQYYSDAPDDGPWTDEEETQPLGGGPPRRPRVSPHSPTTSSSWCDPNRRWRVLLLLGAPALLVLVILGQLRTAEDAPLPPEGGVQDELAGATPQVAWIMSFGGAGTSYTITNTEQVTGLTTATNYGREMDHCVSLLPPSGAAPPGPPFVHKSHLPLPARYILTKTHCGGYCMDCAPSAYVYEFPEDFEAACLTGSSCLAAEDEETATTTTYARTVPRRVVYLTRDPFDNLVGRMHLANALSVKRRSHDSAAAAAASVPVKAFNHSQAGFYEWCRYLDTKYEASEAASPMLSGKVLGDFKSLPCHAEWYRYVQWHNLASQVVDRLDVPVHHLFYENYTNAYDETVAQVLAFIDQPAVHPPLEFYAGKTYRSFFKPEHARMARDLTKRLATPETWKLLAHYFDALGGDSGDDEDKRVSGPAKGGDGQAITPFRSGDGPKVVWLLSFPNSGTSYTITNTEHMSNMSTASNYAKDFDELVPVRPELKNGPFIHDPKLRVPDLVLTKTHCTGYCNECGPSTYIVESVDAFQEGCRRADVSRNGHSVDLVYDASVPVKAVHLTRNPFDNIVARLHLSLHRMRDAGKSAEDLARFSSDRAGLLNWCDHIDTKFGEEERRSDRIPSPIKRMFPDVPCHAEWFRYVQWHNYALEMTERMQLPVHYLYYETYGEDYNRTVADLFQFLDLTPARSPKEFIAGKHYTDYYTPTEQKAAAQLAKALATPRCWELIRPYFDGLLDGS